MRLTDKIWLVYEDILESLCAHFWKNKNETQYKNITWDTNDDKLWCQIMILFISYNWVY